VSKELNKQFRVARSCSAVQCRVPGVVLGKNVHLWKAREQQLNQRRAAGKDCGVEGCNL
jgi:hypothetical protein